MNLINLSSIQFNDNLLQSNKHQKVDCYELVSSSVHWNCAMVLIIDKENATTSYEGLLLLLQKQCKALSIWEMEWNAKSPTIDEFISFFIAQKGFTNTDGKTVAKDYFYDKYQETINGLITEPSFECAKNGLPFTLESLFDKANIKNVICFDDTWQEHHFFVETDAQWLLYHWSSNV